MVILKGLINLSFCYVLFKLPEIGAWFSPHFVLTCIDKQIHRGDAVRLNVPSETKSQIISFRH